MVASILVGLLLIGIIVISFKIKGLSKIQLHRRIFQVIFLFIVISATINTWLFRQGKGISWFQDALFTYVCPIGGVISTFKYFTSSLSPAERLQNPATIIIFSVLLSTVLLGPVFCGWICPFGALQDLLASLGKKINKKYFNKLIGQGVDAWLKRLRYAALAAALILIASSNIKTLESFNPLRAFLNLFINQYTITGTVVLTLIIVLSSVVQRPWCRYLCPYGMFLGLFNKIKFFRIYRNPSTCVSCRKCDRTCPMSIDISRQTVIRSQSCISCMECTSSGGVCPVKNTADMRAAKLERIRTNNVAVSFASGLLIAILVLTGSITTWMASTPAVEEESILVAVEESAAVDILEKEDAASANGLPDEKTYDNKEGEKKQKTAETSADKSTAVKGSPVNSNKKDKEADVAQNTVINKKAVQTTKQEVKNTTGEAKDVKKQEEKRETREEGKKESEVKVEQKKKMYKDGVYTVVVNGYSPGLTVSVRIKNDLITDIKVLKHNETPGFYEQAFKVVPKSIVTNQSVKVDTISGATFTSKGIMKAVEIALSKARQG